MKELLKAGSTARFTSRPVGRPFDAMLKHNTGLPMA